MCSRPEASHIYSGDGMIFLVALLVADRLHNTAAVVRLWLASLVSR